MKKYNFYAGPAILPREVIEEAARAVNDFNGKGLSILEISHRSEDFIQVMERAEAAVRKLLEAGEEYAVLFLSGGASTQFFTLAMNLLDKEERAAYIDTGSWSSKAIKEAAGLAQVKVVASSKDKNYNYIPKDWSLPPDAKYLHITSNNTIFGTRYKEFPEVKIPLVADMSSDIFSRPVPMSRFGLIYAGAQKNMGPAGTTLVVVRKKYLGKVSRHLPTMVNYQTHIEKGSMFNTPPVFPIYVSMLTMEWMLSQGGIAAMEKRNMKKAAKLYDEIDRNSLFIGTAEKEDRSIMNVCFLLNEQKLEETFMAKATEAGCVGIKGHRSVGGYRASIYNAMEMEGVDVLVEVMQDLEKNHG